jgi:hypothetical protein
MTWAHLLESTPILGDAKVVYVDESVPAEDLVTLSKRGYELIDVRHLPRNTPEQNRRAIQAWLQGMAEGTIERDEEVRKTLELSAKMDGLLIQRSMRVNVDASLSSETLDALLSFAPSRHTLIETSAEKLEAARVSSTLPGKLEEK